MGDIADLKDKIRLALKQLEIQRFVHSLKISSFENMSERSTLTYYNAGEDEHDILFILPRPRTTQRSLKVFDGCGNELAILPSYETHEAMRRLSEEYLDTITGCIKHDEKVGEKTSELKCQFRQVFKYGDKKEEVNNAMKTLEGLSKCAKFLDSTAEELCKDQLRELLYLISVQKFYIPFVELRKPFLSGKHYIIYYTVETTGYIRKTSSFYMRGQIDTPFPLSPASVQSYHLEIIPPEGVNIDDFKFEGLEDRNSERSTIMRNKEEKWKYFDDRLLYISFSPEETKEIRKRITKGTTPVVIPTMKINNLLRLLCYLAHPAILLPFFIRVVCGCVSQSHLIASLALVATIIVSASIYAMDKKPVQEFALQQLKITLLLLIFDVIAIKILDYGIVNVLQNINFLNFTLFS